MEAAKLWEATLCVLRGGAFEKNSIWVPVMMIEFILIDHISEVGNLIESSSKALSFDLHVLKLLLIPQKVGA